MEKAREVLTLLGAYLEQYDKNVARIAEAQFFLEANKRLGEQGDVKEAKTRLQRNKADLDLIEGIIVDTFGRPIEECRQLYQEATTAHNQWSDLLQSLYSTQAVLAAVQRSETEALWADIQGGEPIPNMEKMEKALLAQIEAARTYLETLIGQLTINVSDASSSIEVVGTDIMLAR